jgi:hypothetical protein
MVASVYGRRGYYLMATRKGGGAEKETEREREKQRKREMRGREED